MLVPLAPGITAAMGLLGTNLQYEHIRSVITNLYHADEAALSRVNAVIGDLIEAGKAEQMIGAEQRYPERSVGNLVRSERPRTGKGRQQQGIAPDEKAGGDAGDRSSLGRASPEQTTDQGRRELSHRDK